MTDIRAFPGVSYNMGAIKSLSDVVTPPYDVISPEQKKAYLEKSSYNVVRLILPDGEKPYEHAAQLFEDWLKTQILVQDPEPSLYGYQQTFVSADGEEKSRKGFISRIRLEDFDRGIVLPHESTLAAPKQDRLDLLRACKANFSPIFSLYSDPEMRVNSLLDSATQTPPRARVTDEGGAVHSLWRIHEPALIDSICSQMKSHWVLIADGHHRYESCLAYRDEMKRQNPDPEAPFHFTLMFFANLHDPGVEILPYNRGILNLPSFDPAAIRKKASAFFDIVEFKDVNAAAAVLKERGQKTTAFVTQFAGTPGAFLMVLKPETDLRPFYPANASSAVQRLDVNILHKIFLENVLSISQTDIHQQKYLKYYKNQNDERRDFESGALQIAFFMNPTPVQQVVDVSRGGEKMPQKSTFFYPKLLTGLVINRH
jgi:uncharacterized protein (DUF1015 family)